MNRHSAYWAPPIYDNDLEFSEAFRSRIKFSFGLLVVLVVLLALLWNAQPWFEIDIKPVSKQPETPTESPSQPNADKLLQSNVEIINYTVRAGETLSEIAERYGVGLSDLLQLNNLDNPNALRAGQRLKIPQRRNR